MKKERKHTDYRRSPHTNSWMPASLIHTHVHQHDPAGLLVHLQRQYNPTGLPVHSQGCTYSLFIHMDAPSHKTPIKMPLSSSVTTTLYQPVFYVTLYILQQTARQSVCVLQSPGILVVLWPTFVVLSRCVSSPVATGCPFARRGPRGVASPRIFMSLGGTKAPFDLECRSRAK